MQNKKIVEIARKYIGTPWKHQGRGRHGIDCVGLIVVVAKELGIEFDDFLEYGRSATDLSMLEHFERLASPVNIEEIIDGDIIIIAERRFPGHCGILSQNQEFIIHSSTARRKVTEERLSLVNGDIIRAYRIGKK